MRYIYISWTLEQAICTYIIMMIKGVGRRPDAVGLNEMSFKSLI